LTKALVIDPKMDPALYSGDRSLFDSARKAVRDRDLSSITVSTEPQGGRVFVDGRFRGVAPAIRPGLRQGVHFVRVERQGFGRVGRTVKTTAGAEGPDVSLDLTQNAVRNQAVLTSLLPGLRSDMGKPQVDKGSAIARLAGVLLVDYAVLFQTMGPANARVVTLTLYDTGSGKLLKKVQGTVDWAARDRSAKNAVLELAKGLLDVDLKTEIKVGEVPPTEGGEDEASSDGIHTKWWFWTIIGAAVVGTTVGLAVGLQPEDTAPAGLNKDGNGALILKF